jgi:S1-C subfamily serine protease
MGIGFTRLSRSGAVFLALGCGLLAGCGAAEPGACPAAATLSVSDNFDAAKLEEQFQHISARAARAVVAISATDGQALAKTPFHCDDINGDQLSSMLSAVDRTVGTGFIVDQNGFILTNDHVVAHAENLWITTDDRRVYPAVVIGSDPRNDLALLKVPATHLPVATLADGSTMKRGQWTIALGNPYGLASEGEMCASVGVVSAVDRSLTRLSEKEDRLYSGLIETTAQINPGNSGGPLLNLAGNVVAVNTAVILPQKQTNGIGFAIPLTHHLIDEIELLKQGRPIVYGYLGVRVSSPTPHERRDADLPDEAGARIDSVEDNSPAAGQLQDGDIIIRFNRQAVRNGDQLVRLVGESPVGEPLRADIHRGSAFKTVWLTLKPRDPDPALLSREEQRLRWRGLVLGAIPSNWDFGAGARPTAGVMVLAIDSNSPFYHRGPHQGDVIVAVSGKSVSDLEGMRRVINQSPSNECTLQLASMTMEK